MTNRHPIRLGLLAVAAVAAFASTGATAEEPVLGPSVEQTEHPRVWNNVNRGSLRAIVQPAQDIRLSARAAGIIQRYAAEEGQPVARNAPILILDDHQEKAELAQAEAVLKAAQAEFARAEGEFERARPLSQERIFSEKQFAEAKYAVEVARSRVAQAEAALALSQVRLADRTIISPFDGVFLKKAKGVGEAVERFEPVARIVDLSYLEIVVFCDASLFGTFRTEQAVSVQVSKSEDSPVEVVQGTISFVDPMIDPASGTFRVRVRFPRSTSAAPGYTAILLPESKSVAVPAR